MRELTERERLRDAECAGFVIGIEFVCQTAQAFRAEVEFAHLFFEKVDFLLHHRAVDNQFADEIDQNIEIFDRNAHCRARCNNEVTREVFIRAGSIFFVANRQRGGLSGNGSFCFNRRVCGKFSSRRIFTNRG